MSTLTGQYISQSYGGLIKLSTNTGIVAGTSTQLEDGVGTALGIYFRTGGQINATGYTGSLLGNASTATTATSASYATNAGSAATAITASFVNTASFAISSTSASYALVSSTAANAILLNGTASSVFATTGSNTFRANQSISASLNISGSFTVGAGNVNINTTVYSTGSSYGNIQTLSVSSLTASMNLSTGNLFTLTLVSGFDTHVVPTNIAAGQTISLRVIQPGTGIGTISFPSTVAFPSSSYFVATPIVSAEDVVTMISFTNTKLNAVASNYFITN